VAGLSKRERGNRLTTEEREKRSACRGVEAVYNLRDFLGEGERGIYRKGSIRYLRGAGEGDES